MSATKKAEIMEKVQASRSPIRQVLRQSGGSSTSTTIAGTTRHSRTSPQRICWLAEGKKSSAGEGRWRTGRSTDVNYRITSSVSSSRQP